MNYNYALILALMLLPFSLGGQSLKVSENNRFLVRDKGEGFFWLGDTGWEMLHRLDRKEIEHYLRNRSGKGFTVIQTVILSEINGITVPNREGNLPLFERDPEKPNEKYFELVDFAVEKAAEFDLYLALLPTWGAYVNDRNHPLFETNIIFNPENAYSYGKYLGERYKKHPNIVWVLGGDRPATGFEEVWNAMARGLGDGDGGTHLMTYHPRGQQTSSEWFHEADWLDFNMIQTGHQAPSFNVYDWISNDYELDPPKPVLNGEPSYEDIGIWFNKANPVHDAYEIRKQAYWCVFAGAFGHTYGNNNVWQMYREEYTPVIWADTPWDEALEHEGAGQLIHLRRLMESRPFLDRIPDQNLLMNENPSFATDHIRITRDGEKNKKDASYIMVYLPYYRSFEVNTSVIPSDKLRIWWYSPSTGQALPQGVFDNKGSYGFSNWDELIKEGQPGPDWVIVIDDANVKYSAPGMNILNK